MFEKSKLLSVTKQKIEGIVFFAMFYLYLWLVVDLRLVSGVGGGIAKFPVFYKDWDFFSETCAMPGGLVEYLSSFLVQFFYYSWSGSIIVTLQAFLIYFFSKKFLDALKMSNLSYISFAGPIIILALYNNYIYFFNIASGLLAALVFTSVYILLEKKKIAHSLLLFLILSVVLYPIAGGSLLMFCFLCMIYEGIGRSNLLVASTELLLAFGVAFVGGVWIYDIGIYEAFSRLLPIHSYLTYIIFENTKLTAIACSLYLFLPLISLFLCLGQKIPASRFLPFKRDCIRNQQGSKGNFSSRILFHLGESRFLILLILTSLAVYLTYNGRRKNVYAADYYACNRNWAKALEAAERDIEYPLMIFIVNRTLHHMGRLPKDMFLYPQHKFALHYAACAPPEIYKGVYQETDLYIDLGLFNYAERSIWEQLEALGPLPELLKRLAIINMVKGDMGAARVYLNRLGKTIFYADWGKEYLAKLEADPTLSTDEYIQDLRRKNLKSDHIAGSKDVSWTFTRLLNADRHNKMAFEYLMAFYLLDKDLEGFVENLHGLEDFDYTKNPQTYEEAFCIYLLLKGNVKVPENFLVSEESKRKFQAFKQFMDRQGGDPRAVENEVITNYKNTYYEYFFSGYKYNPGGSEHP